MTIDWRLGLIPDDIGTSVAQAFQTGRAMAKQNALEGAYKSFADDPVAGAKAVAAIDPIQGFQLQAAANAQQDRANSIEASSHLAQNDQAGALAAAGKLPADQMLAVQQHLATLSEAQRKLESDHAEVLAGIGHGLLARPYEERKSIIAHMAPALAARGFKPEEIAGFDPTDENITALQNSAMTLKDILAREDAANKPVAFAEGSQVYRTGDLTGQPAVPASAGATVIGDGAPAPAAAPVQATPQDADALARMIMTEAAGEGAQGMAAAGAVALNRLRQGYGGAKTLVDVVNAPHQFEGMTSGRAGVSTNDPAYQHALQVAQGLISGQIADPTNGAVNFLNPELQTSLGRAIPGWAAGQGRRIGKHVFFGGGQGEASPAPAPAPAGNQPYEVASNGPTPPPPSSALSPTSATPAPVSNPTAAAFAPKPILTVPKKTGHASTPDEIKAAGLPAGTAAWTDTNGKPTPYPDSMQPHNPGAGSDLTGDAFLATLPKGYAAQIKGYANGDIAMPSGNRAGSRDQQRLLNDIMQYDPSASAANLSSRTAIRKAFTSGPYSQTINATNTVIGHIGDLDKAIDRLHNTGIPLYNKTAQAFGQNLGNQDTQASLASFNTYKTMVANELTKVYRGTGGAEADIQGWMNQLDAAQSPAALKATVKAMVTGLKSRIDSLGVTYSSGMGKTTDPFSLLTPRAKTVFDRLYGAGDDDAAAPASANSGQGWKVIAVH